MSEQLSGFPFWLLAFEKDGQPTDAGAIDRMVSEVATGNFTDLFVFSHGWNNDRSAALSLYARFFEQVGKVISDTTLTKKRPDARLGVAGVVWPSILWPDDAASSASSDVVSGAAGGGASAVGNAPPAAVFRATAPEINAELKKGYANASQRTLIDELTALLAKESPTDAALGEFHTKLAQLLASEPADSIADHKSPDYAEGAIGTLTDAQWRGLLDVLGGQAMRRTGLGGGAAGLGDPFKKLWSGAKDALRIATYWQMKQRAGIVGREGLGRVLAKLAESAKTTRVHLLGHSFGARLVSFSLSGLPSTAAGDASQVKSLFLLQGAFSHYAFADRLPHDASRAGALKGMAGRVDGPLLTTHSLKDLAVGLSYPAASFVNRDDAAAAIDQGLRWGAMGHDGAQAVDAGAESLSAPGKKYALAKGKWLNLDGNKVIIHGGLPSGAHSDIVSPHTAWAALAAAGVV